VFCSQTLTPDSISFTATWRKFLEIQINHASTTTTELLARIAALRAVEEGIRGKATDLRMSGPELKLHRFFITIFNFSGIVISSLPGIVNV
jgi:hypothetical protein